MDESPKKAGVRARIKEAIRKRQIEPGKPLVFEGEEWGLDAFTPELDRELRFIRDKLEGQCPFGFAMTFHRGHPRGGKYAEVDPELNHEAGEIFPNPTGLEELERPIPDEEIVRIEIRALVFPMFAGMEPHDERYEKREKKDELGIGDSETGLIHSAAMTVASCIDGKWSEAVARPYSELGVVPNAQVLHYGSGNFEGMTAEWGEDGNCYIFGMKDHYKRMKRGAVRLSMDVIPRELFERAAIKAVQENARFIPKNGRLYIRPHCANIGSQMRVGGSRMTGFFVEATPIGTADSYFGPPEYDAAGNARPKVMCIPVNKLRSGDGLGGDIKHIGNYALTVAHLGAVEALNFAEEGEAPHHPKGVLYLDRLMNDPAEREKAEFRETNASNTLFFRDLENGKYQIITPDGKDILPGHTRELILNKAKEHEWEVEMRPVTVKEVMEGKFCAAANCGTAAVLSPFDALHFVEIVDGENTVTGKLVEDLITIRNPEEIKESPIPEPVKILLDDILAVKSGRSSDKDKEKYLTQVPGIKFKEAVPL